MNCQAFQERLCVYQKAERHRSRAETVYWLNRYKLLAEQAVAALAAQPSGQAQRLNPITVSTMKDDGGDEPSYCVMAAYRTLAEAHVLHQVAMGGQAQQDAEDAARYRWLRKSFVLTGNGNGTYRVQIANLPSAMPESIAFGPSGLLKVCEAAIDAARKEQQP